MRNVLAIALAACASHAATTSEPFDCGTLTCDAATQYCSVTEATHPGGSATYVCVVSDGGMPSCGSDAVTSPGMCGCYASPSGDITVTQCPP